MLRRGVTAATTLLALTAIRSPVAANGRFPNATQLVASPADPKHFLLRTTYGVIQTFDNGGTWAWSCERAVGYSGAFDPAFAISGTGAVLAGLSDGLARSGDRGCEWARQPSLAGKYVIDLAVDPRNAMRVVGVTAGERASVIESIDGGATWLTVSELDADVRAETLDATASDGQRLYVSGALSGDPNNGVLLRSDDGGRTFKRHLIELRGGAAPFIAAVDPTNADVVYLRINVSDRPDGGVGTDHLVVTTDGGGSFRNAATATGQMLGVALSPDGSKIAYGGPRDGLLVASTSDFALRRVGSHSARCLAWRSEGMYVCVPEGELGFTVGLSTDDGASFRRFYTVTKVTELKCAASTSTGAMCPADWPAIYSMVEDDVVIGADASIAPRAQPAAPEPGKGCSGCAADGAHSRASGLLGLVLLTAWSVARSRRSTLRAAPSQQRAPSDGAEQRDGGEEPGRPAGR